MVRVTYLRDDAGYDDDGNKITGKPVVCLAFEHEKGSDTFKYQMAVLHPKEKCLKKLATAIAIGRLNKRPIQLSVPTDLDDFKLNVPTLCKIAMARNIVSNPASPKRAVKVASMWGPV